MGLQLRPWLTGVWWDRKQVSERETAGNPELGTAVVVKLCCINTTELNWSEFGCRGAQRVWPSAGPLVLCLLCKEWTGFSPACSSPPPHPRRCQWSDPLHSETHQEDERWQQRLLCCSKDGVSRHLHQPGQTELSVEPLALCTHTPGSSSLYPWRPLDPDHVRLRELNTWPQHALKGQSTPF